MKSGRAPWLAPPIPEDDLPTLCISRTCNWIHGVVDRFQKGGSYVGKAFSTELVRNHIAFFALDDSARSRAKPVRAMQCRPARRFDESAPDEHRSKQRFSSRRPQFHLLTE